MANFLAKALAVLALGCLALLINGLFNRLSLHTPFLSRWWEALMLAGGVLLGQRIADRAMRDLRTSQFK